MRGKVHYSFDAVRGIVICAAVVALLAVGCHAGIDGEQAGPECQPSCDGRTCGDDGCGGSCGECEAEGSCTADGQCVQPTVDAGCLGTCAELGWECGEACGESCGECSGEQVECHEHLCQCLPACDASTCLAADGCGADCGPCGNVQNCDSCALQLSVVDQVVVDGLLVELTLAVDYLPPEGKTLPTMADIRLAVSGPAELKQVGLGPPVTEADKELFTSPETGKAFQVLDGGIHQILVFSSANTKTIIPGRWLLLKFKMGPQSAADAANWAAAPAVFQLVEREETLAPAGADATLWAGGYDVPVVVWAQASEVSDDQ